MWSNRHEIVSHTCQKLMEISCSSKNYYFWGTNSVLERRRKFIRQCYAHMYLKRHVLLHCATNKYLFWQFKFLLKQSHKPFFYAFVQPQTFILQCWGKETSGPHYSEGSQTLRTSYENQSHEAFRLGKDRGKSCKSSTCRCSWGWHSNDQMQGQSRSSQTGREALRPSQNLLKQIKA